MGSEGPQAPRSTLLPESWPHGRPAECRAEPGPSRGSPALSALLQANLTKSQNEFKIVLKELEDSLLARLSAASGNFLGDTALIENLETTKHTANEIEEKVGGRTGQRVAAGLGGGTGASPGRPPRAPQDSSRRGGPLCSPVVCLLVSLGPLLSVSRCKRQKSQKSKSTRRERATGPRPRERPCCTSS